MSESYQWKSVDANLSVKVTPYVSEDRHITLEIEFEQTEFTDRVADNAPPGTATRSFRSIVKVQNEEMVLLGGLDRNSMESPREASRFWRVCRSSSGSSASRSATRSSVR